MVGGSQPHAGSVKGVVIGLGQRKMVPYQGLVTWGSFSAFE